MKKIALLAILAVLVGAAFGQDAAPAGQVAPAAPAPETTAADTVETTDETSAAETVTTEIATPASEETEAAVPAAGLAQARGERYSVTSELGQASATELAAKLDALFGVYNEYLRFDADALAVPLKVRIFATKASFDAYLEKVVGQTREDFVYLHYSTVERSELVLFDKADPEDFAASLAHQAFVQFLKAFVPNPPLWIQEGFAVFFETARPDAATGEVDFPDNTAWLETVKSLEARGALLKPAELLAVGLDASRENRDVFYPQSWAFVAFLSDSEDRSYNRFLWDAISSLDPKAGFEANQAATLGLFDSWYDAAEAEADFLAWLDGQKTFADLVTDGVAAYGAGDIDLAGKTFSLALEKNESNYIPYYYLGLVAYAKSDFALADFYYKSALELGCDPAVTNYALGINAFASNRFEDARSYLEFAKSSAPERYTAKVDELVARIEE
ncbi:MAG: hypothetical protein JXA15_09915 [Spirochaetales bacterium]|nr:hypothetical protein [Spirochaetales bacterium]